MCYAEVAKVGKELEEELAALRERVDAAGVRHQALAQVRKRMERDMASSLERAWTGGGYGLVDGGLVTVCGSDQALKAVELLPVYPWKCLVHLHETELGLGLGLGVCTLSWSPLAVEAALRSPCSAAPPPPPTVTS